MGGLCGCVNWVIYNVIIMVPGLKEFDGMGLSIFVSCILARAIFTKEGPLGSKDSIREIGLLKTDNGRIAWQANQSTNFPRAMVFGGCCGGLFGAIAIKMIAALQPLVDSGTVEAGTIQSCAVLIGWACAIFSLLPAFFSNKNFANVPS